MAATRSPGRPSGARTRSRESPRTRAAPSRVVRPRTGTSRTARRARRAGHRSRARGSRRLIAVFVISVLAFAAIGARLVVLQVAQFPRFAELAAEQRERQVIFPAHRGAIFDRNGESLAISVQLQTVFTDHVHVKDVYRTAAALAPVLGQSREELEQKLQPGWEGDQFEYLARQIGPKLAQRVELLELPGIYVKPEPKRVYPSDRLASQVIGFVNADGDALEGIELQYDEILSGRPGLMDLEQDPQGRPLPQADFLYEPAEPGRSLYLTIDKQLQFITETTLAHALTEYKASSGSAVILRPRSGEILAMANMPDYDLNYFSDSDPDYRRNRAVVDNYEPGSAFKVVTSAAVLEENVVTPRTVFTVPDQIQVVDRVIHDSHYHPIEDMTVSEIIEQSSNVGTVKLGLELGADRLDKWIRKFGFGTETGLDFPGEAEGLLLDREDWWGTSIGTIPLGQGIAVTPLQLLMAYSTIANDGMWVEPKLVHSTMTENGEIVDAPDPARRRILSRFTSRQMMSILSRVVTDGTGVMAQIPGYQVAGKTGTAQKPSEAGGYEKDAFMATFVGLAPADRPEIAVIVVLDEPSPIWGGASAAPTFKLIAEQALRHLGVPPTSDAASSALQIEADQAAEPAPRD
jgi:cell division protein FtsI (penicillin-binding protein 3)